MKMDVLKCKMPEMVEKAVWIHLLGDNLIRSTTVRARRRPGCAAGGELQGCVADDDGVRGRAAMEGEAGASAPLEALCICGHRVGDRPGRVEPRAITAGPSPRRP